MFARYIRTPSRLVGSRTLPAWGKVFHDHMRSIDHQFDPGHRIDHVMRVTNTALRIAEIEGARLEIVMPAVMLHDSLPMDKFAKNSKDASRISADNSIKLLREWGYPQEHHSEIERAILSHSFTANIKPESLEAKVVQDADRLDALGAIGIARTFAVGFKHGNPLYNFDEPFPIDRDADDHANILDHFYLKLLRLPETLHTDAAKQEAVTRIKTMEVYLQDLAREIGVEYVSYENYKNNKIIKKEINMLRQVENRKKLMCAGTLDINTAEAMMPVIEAGYRYFDLATAYKGCHQALADAMQKYNRAEFHICSKINDGDLIDNNFSVQKILDKILKDLRTDYLDTLMLHSPALLLHEHAVEVMEELIELKKQGKIRHIGVSNFEIKHLERLGVEYRKHIDYNQIELSPYLQQTDLAAYCAKNNIQVMAYRPFGKGKGDMLQDAELNAIAQRHNATVHQVILAWIMQQNTIAIPKAGSRHHLDSNMQACSLTLEPAEMKVIADIGVGKKVKTCPPWEKFAKLKDMQKFEDVRVTRPLKSSGDFSVFASSEVAAPAGDANLSRLAAKM